MSDFRFADPHWAHALWGVLALVVLLFWLERRGGGALERLVGATLRDRLVRRPSRLRRRLRILLLGLAVAAAVVALMRPQFGVRHVAAQRVGAEIMVALDVSRSMLAEDVAPNRLERAKAEIVDLLAYLDGDQVGLIAFSGRASVLAPLTPDFGFLRLVLDGVGPHSVTRGGTRLEEPIRKAVQGFGPPGEAARAILLITDGEDHDSFPLDAAAEAAEAGIVIIAIGFGDENGSEISVTDPRTGGRELLRDSDGRPVRSRLDGDLLRDLALATGGAYVPAGTGVLDLESIYNQYIAKLTAGRLDPRGRSVRDEGYQWAVLLALAGLIASAAISGRGTAIALLLALLATPPTLAEAQGPADSPPAAGDQATAPQATGSGVTAGDAGDPGPAVDAPAGEVVQTPREIYNAGVRALAEEDFDAAILRFEDARRDAGADAELRVRAAYDLGLASAGRGERLEQESPEEALRAFHTAADWFRDAIRLRPDADDPRANLEVALRRALLLADRLAQADTQGVEARLAEVAERQRSLVGGIADLIRAPADAPDVFVDEPLRREYGDRASTQRALLSDADDLARAVDAERAALVAKPEAERTPEDAMRAEQFEALLGHFHRARESMGQTRRQLRQRQGERAYRRGTAALSHLKRALDQLRDPAGLLDALLRDATEVASGTAVLASAATGIAAPPAPAWLSEAALAEDQQAVADRTDELVRRLEAGSEAEPAPDRADVQAAVQAAQPFVVSAHGDFVAAADRLGAGDLPGAWTHQREAIVALSEARERFLDLRGLIEATHFDESRLVAVLADETEAAAERRAEFLPALRELQARNIDRGERLEVRIVQAAERAAAPAADGTAADPEAAAIEKQRGDLASQLLTLALAQMDTVKRELAGAPAGWAAARAAGETALKHLEALRRLFFTIVEELRETAREQQDLGDETRDAATLSGTDAEAAAKRLGPLPERQTALARRAGEIANALAEQSDQTGGVMAEEADGFETSRRLRLAGEHVILAQTAMESASDRLAETPPQHEGVQEQQAEAMAQLREALALLVPPEEREQNGEQQEQEQEQQQNAEAGEQDEAEQAEPPPAVDPAQLLQAVRDKEAQRRRDREQGGRIGSETVEKDW